jgi:hypothetical protein
VGPLPRPQHLLLAKRFRCNSLDESASTQVGIREIREQIVDISI